MTKRPEYGVVIASVVDGKVAARRPAMGSLRKTPWRREAARAAPAWATTAPPRHGPTGTGRRWLPVGGLGREAPRRLLRSILPADGGGPPAWPGRGGQKRKAGVTDTSVSEPGAGREPPRQDGARERDDLQGLPDDGVEVCVLRLEPKAGGVAARSSQPTNRILSHDRQKSEATPAEPSGEMRRSEQR